MEPSCHAGRSTKKKESQGGSFKKILLSRSRSACGEGNKIFLKYPLLSFSFDGSSAFLWGGDLYMIATALENVTSVFNAAVTMVTGNDVAMVFIGISLAGAGIALFRKVIHK